MGKTGEATFSGYDSKYRFAVYPADAKLKDVAAVYIFTRRTEADGKASHDLLYIGETDRLRKRLANHEKWPQLRKLGVNCVCVLEEEDDERRLDVETDLRRRHHTPCNAR